MLLARVLKMSDIWPALKMTRSLRHRRFSAGSCTGKYTSPAEKLRFLDLGPFLKRANSHFFHREPSQRSEAEVAWSSSVLNLLMC
jgi:hypothetical protein